MSKTESKIVPQIQFESLKDFVKFQNNYYVYFVLGGISSNSYRNSAHFKRFKEQNGDLEKTVTAATTYAVRSSQAKKLPYELLWKSYKIMSNLVYSSDESVMSVHDPSWFLTL